MPISNYRSPSFNKKGFSLVEVVIAVFVMLVGMVGVIRLVSSNIIHSADSRDTIIAAELAQEGVELVRNVRDNNIAQNAPNGGFSYFSRLAITSDYRIDRTYIYNPPPTSPTNFTLSPPSYQLYYNVSYYDHNVAGTLTKFQRKIVVNWDNWAKSIFDRATIRSIVIWNSGSIWPTPPNYSDCTISNKCVMTDVILGGG